MREARIVPPALTATCRISKLLPLRSSPRVRVSSLKSHLDAETLDAPLVSSHEVIGCCLLFPPGGRSPVQAVVLPLVVVALLRCHRGRVRRVVGRRSGRPLQKEERTLRRRL